MHFLFYYIDIYFIIIIIIIIYTQYNAINFGLSLNLYVY